MRKPRMNPKFLRLCSYILVAALASAATWAIAPGTSKLDQLANLIDRRFIGEADMTLAEDTAAAAMVAALGDRWSYYIPAKQYAAHLQNENNEYVGIGVTIQKRQDGLGFDIIAVEEEGPAAKAGILPGDIMTYVDATPVSQLDMTGLRKLIMGEKNTKLTVTVQRAEETLEFTLTRKAIHTEAATGQMLTEQVGYVSIANFHTGAAKETIAVIEQLLAEGAQKLVLDVRDNLGGFTDELVSLLDYLLPEGPLFKTVNYYGIEDLDYSNAACLELPMAVLINGNSYSAAEFFAAALSEYDWAVTVGEKTVGKGYYQITTRLSDGSAVNLSVGKYFTPNGVNLAEAGGLEPEIFVEPAQSYVSIQDDPQVQAAVAALTGKT